MLTLEGQTCSCRKAFTNNTLYISSRSNPRTQERHNLRCLHGLDVIEAIEHLNIPAESL
jgi:hypothetical protein